MKKVLSMLLTTALVLSCLIGSAFAADTWGGYTISASKSEAAVGDTVDFTVYLDDCSALEGGVHNIEFKVTLPEGLSYVSGSGKLNADFESKTGLTSPRFNEKALKVSALGALSQGYTGGKIAVLTFSCKVEKEGALQVGLTSIVLTDQDCASRTPAVTTATVTASPAHEHSYGTEWEKDGSQHWQECACGDKIDVAEHTFQWVVDKKATETESGLKHEECTICGYTRSENTEIPAVPAEHVHDYAEIWECDDLQHWHECECGDKIDEAEHTFQWIIDAEATETKDGFQHEECAVCGYAKAGVTIPADGSDADDETGDNDEDDDDSDASSGSGNSSNSGSSSGSKLDNVPKTGDITILYDMVLLAAVAAAAVAGLLIKRKAAK